MKTLLLAFFVVMLPNAALSADLNRFSDEHFSTPSSSTSGWELWGTLSLGFEYYEDNFGYEEAAANTSGEVVFKAPSGFNFKISLGGSAYDQDYVSGVANLDLFYASPEFAAGVYAGSFATTNDFESVWVGLEAAKFFSHADIGAFVQVDGFSVGDPIYAAGVWLKGYLTPNTLLGVNYEYDWNNNIEANFLTVHAEHRFAGKNFGAYTDIERSWQLGNYKSWDILGGVRLYFDREGTTLQGYQRAASPFWSTCCF